MLRVKKDQLANRKKKGSSGGGRYAFDTERYKQRHAVETRKHQVVGRTRFKLAIIYAVIGLAVGGKPYLLTSTAAVTLLLTSLALSIAVGLLRGRLTKMWATPDGQIYSQGTPLTIGLFSGLIVAKFAMGTAAYFLHISDDGGIGEILLMIAVMVAFQAELIWRRARGLGLATGRDGTSGNAGHGEGHGFAAGRQ